MKLTQKAVNEIGSHEAVVLETYMDSEGNPTWGMGVTSKSGHDVLRYKNNPSTLQKAMDVYVWLLEIKYLPAVERAFQKPLTEAQMAAALSFHWNTGGISVADWVHSYNAGAVEEARREFMNWRSPPSIIERREKERDLFFDGKWSGDGKITHWTTVNNMQIDWSKAKRIKLPSLKKSQPKATPVTFDLMALIEQFLKLLRGLFK